MEASGSPHGESLTVVVSWKQNCVLLAHSRFGPHAKNWLRSRCAGRLASSASASASTLPLASAASLAVSVRAEASPASFRGSLSSAKQPLLAAATIAVAAVPATATIEEARSDNHAPRLMRRDRVARGGEASITALQNGHVRSPLLTRQLHDPHVARSPQLPERITARHRDEARRALIGHAGHGGGSSSVVTASTSMLHQNSRTSSSVRTRRAGGRLARSDLP